MRCLGGPPLRVERPAAGEPRHAANAETPAGPKARRAGSRVERFAWPRLGGAVGGSGFESVQRSARARPYANLVREDGIKGEAGHQTQGGIFFIVYRGL